jgi:hypothetical protein
MCPSWIEDEFENLVVNKPLDNLFRIKSCNGDTHVLYQGGQRRIQGITDLTTLIKNMRITITTLNPKQVIKWLVDNKVLELIFDPARTHL